MINTNSTICEPIKNDTYDFLFIGLGASNSLILLSLIKNKQLHGKKIGIIEPEHKNINDKTFCFWAKPTDDIVNDLKPLISYQYKKIKLINKEQDIEDQPYYYIKSLDLYNHTLEKLKPYQIDIFRDTAFEFHTENNILFINTKSGNVYKTKFALDSRPPSLEKLPYQDIYLHQSFYGLHIKCEENKFNKDSFEMMNFNIEQSNYTQFVYTLPFSENEAMVELTRFGKEKIELEYAKELLHKYITQEIGRYSILDIETGCIPMTSFRNNANQNASILNTGSGANLIKPSTGYGFKKMFEFGKLAAEVIKQNDLKTFNKTNLKSTNRFKFYDKLLLIILFYWPSDGKKIFTQLFTKKNISSVFLFLDEKTTLIQDIKIFVRLPIISFIKSLFIYMKLENYFRFFVLIASISIYFIIHLINPEWAISFSYVLIIIGFLLVGIPHGSLDHLTLKNKKIKLVKFIIYYISIVMSYLIIWHYFPIFSLLLFILFSSFHFGESELHHKGLKIQSITDYFEAALLGFGILSFILCSHVTESINIIQKIIHVPLTFTHTSTFFLLTKIACAIVLLALCAYSFSAKKNRITAILITLLIGFKMPLILAFSMYFIFHHSINSWNHIKHGLNLNSLGLYKKALPFTLGAFALLILTFTTNMTSYFSENEIAAITFIFLACISLPHIILMSKFYKNTH
jgi:lycopene beta-cyclase